MTCAVCGRPLIGTEVVGRYWVWIHHGGATDHRAQPVKGARQ